MTATQARELERGARSVSPTRRSPICRRSARGLQPKWLGKQLLAAIGVRTPGRRSRPHAGRSARRLAGTRRLSRGAQGAGWHAGPQDRGGRRPARHQGSKADLRRSTGTSCTPISPRRQPDLALDGVLVEKDGAKGAGADDRRQARSPSRGRWCWPGLGGIWVEAHWRRPPAPRRHGRGRHRRGAPQAAQREAARAASAARRRWTWTAVAQAPSP